MHLKLPSDGWDGESQVATKHVDVQVVSPHSGTALKQLVLLLPQRWGHR